MARKPVMGKRRPNIKFMTLHEPFKVYGKNWNLMKVNDFWSSYPKYKNMTITTTKYYCCSKREVSVTWGRFIAGALQRGQMFLPRNSHRRMQPGWNSWSQSKAFTDPRYRSSKHMQQTSFSSSISALSSQRCVLKLERTSSESSL